LTPLPSVVVKPPRVAESSFHMECELYKTMDVGEGDVGSAVIVVGKILLFHVDEAVYNSERGWIEPVPYQPIARMGGINYSTLGEIFGIPRPKVGKK